MPDAGPPAPVGATLTAMGDAAAGTPVPPLIERLGPDFFDTVPSGPGVYFMLGEGDALLYVGKAKNLRSRLRAYARIGPGDDPRMAAMVTGVVAVRWEEHGSDAEATRRETELLRGLRPPFNVTHAAPSAYLSIALQEREARTRLRLASGPDGATEILYAYPFDASTPDAFKALVRVLVLARPAGPGPPPGGLTGPPASVARSSGTQIVLSEELSRSLHSFLSGASGRLLGHLERILAERVAGDPVLHRAVARDLRSLRSFFRAGPAVVRRLQRTHGARPGPCSAQELEQLIAADLQSQIGAVVAGDRAGIEARVVGLRRQGMGFGAIADQLNDERVPRLRGGGRWRAVDVAEVVEPRLTGGAIGELSYRSRP